MNQRLNERSIPNISDLIGKEEKRKSTIVVISEVGDNLECLHNNLYIKMLPFSRWYD